MSDVKWIKIVTDIFDDEKILLIESLPSADSIIVIWFKLLCLAGKNNNKGVFMMNDRIAYTDEMLATIFRRDVNTVRFALKTFEEYGMIELINNVITIPNWSKHQTLDAYEKKKTRDKIYQQEKRAKQRLLIEKSSDKSLDISPDVVALEEEKEEEEDIYNKKEKEKSNFDVMIENYTSNKNLQSTLYDFIKMRKTIKSQMTDRALKILFTNLNKFTNNDEIKIKILEQSILGGWKGVYQLKDNNTSNPNDGRYKEFGSVY